eukprot:TRINITY_DN585_c0_g6_i1.p1 TRINITY_DN585_c0_g6~~TRINITY_DN585_c0_g6_i1.p1  ORF type:complete len:443 (+),score=122.33 TRINITY_DN585_c0_g6_i1:70-1398(+)
MCIRDSFDAFSDPPLSFNESNNIVKSLNDLPQSKKTSTISSQTLKDSAVSMPVLGEVQETPLAESEQTSSSFKVQSDTGRLSPSHKSSTVLKESRVSPSATSSLKGSIPQSADKEQVRGTVMSSPGKEFTLAKSPEQPTKEPEKIKLAPMKKECNVSDSLKSPVPRSSTHTENLIPNSKASILSKEQGEAKILLPNESLARPSESLAAKDGEGRAESDLAESIVVARDKTIVSPNRELTRAKDKDISVVSNEQIEEVKVVSKASASSIDSKNKLEEDKSLSNVSKAHKITLSKRTEIRKPMTESKSPQKAENTTRAKEQPKVSSPVPNISSPTSEPSPLKPHSITSVIADIASGNVADAGAGIEAQLKAYASKVSLDANEKKVVAILSRYKFVVRILERMRELQQNDAAQSADLANVLTRVKVSNKVKPLLYNIAVSCYVSL